MSPPVTDELSERSRNRSTDLITSDNEIKHASTRDSLKRGMSEPTRDSNKRTTETFAGVRRSTRRGSLSVLSKCTLVEVLTTEAKPTGVSYYIPKTHAQAIMSTDAARWIEAEDSEKAGLVNAGVMQLVPLPHKAKVIPCKWVYCLKTGSLGNIIRFKARLVIRGDL